MHKGSVGLVVIRVKAFERAFADVDGDRAVDSAADVLDMRHDIVRSAQACGIVQKAVVMRTVSRVPLCGYEANWDSLSDLAVVLEPAPWTEGPTSSSTKAIVSG
jgi:hypothetical protein